MKYGTIHAQLVPQWYPGYQTAGKIAMPLVNLTARYVETIKAAGTRLEIRDAKVEGLELRVMASGAKSWALRYRRESDGTKRTHTLGRYPVMTLEEARGAAQDARRAVAKGARPGLGKTRPQGRGDVFRPGRRMA